MKINETVISRSKGEKKRDGHYLIDILKDLKYFYELQLKKLGQRNMKKSLCIYVLTVLSTKCNFELLFSGKDT